MTALLFIYMFGIIAFKMLVITNNDSLELKKTPNDEGNFLNFCNHLSTPNNAI